MARVRKSLASLKRAAESNDSKGIYESMRDDIIANLPGLGGTEYIQAMMMLLRVQNAADKIGLDAEEDSAETLDWMKTLQAELAAELRSADGDDD